MRRPNRYSDDIKRLAIEDILAEVDEWMGHPVSDIEKTDLVRAFDVDGYNFARNLDCKGWGADFELVEILSGASLYRHQENAVAAWVVANEIKVPFDVGDTVTVRGQAAMVVKIDHDHAKIIVQPVESDGSDYGKTGGWVHAFEDALADKTVACE